MPFLVPELKARCESWREVTLQGDLLTAGDPWHLLSCTWPWEEGARDQQQPEDRGLGSDRPHVLRAEDGGRRTSSAVPLFPSGLSFCLCAQAPRTLPKPRETSLLVSCYRWV